MTDILHVEASDMGTFRFVAKVECVVTAESEEAAERAVFEHISQGSMPKKRKRRGASAAVDPEVSIVGVKAHAEDKYATFITGSVDWTKESAAKIFGELNKPKIADSTPVLGDALEQS